MMHIPNSTPCIPAFEHTPTYALMHSLHHAWLNQRLCCPVKTSSTPKPLLYPDTDLALQLSFARAVVIAAQAPCTQAVDGVLQVYSGGLDNNITVWDLRKGEQSMSLTGHTDSITGLSLNPDGTHLLSNAVDNSLRVWDMRPYAPTNRCEKVFTGHQHNYERNLLRCSWSSDGSKVCCTTFCSARCVVKGVCLYFGLIPRFAEFF